MIGRLTDWLTDLIHLLSGWLATNQSLALSLFSSCNVGDEVDSSYVCDTDDTIQDFQFKSFRFTEQDSGSVYLHVRAKVCLADYGSSECNLYCNGPFPCGFEDRKRRSVNQNPRNNSADNRYAKPYFVDIGPIRVAEEQKGISYCYSVDIVLLRHNNAFKDIHLWSLEPIFFRKLFSRKPPEAPMLAWSGGGGGVEWSGGGMRVSIAYNLCYLSSIFLHVNLHD